MLKLKIFNIFKQQPPSKMVDKNKGVLKWGDRDDFPLVLINSVQESHTASACLDTFIDYLEGDGISDLSLAGVKVNKTETFDDFHSKVSKDEGYLETIAVNVKYNLQGDKVELHALPAESVRLGKPDDTGYISKILYNPHFGTREYKDSETKYFDVYNPDKEVVLKQINRYGEKYNGQVLYLSTERPLKRFYSDPFYSSAINWFNVDSKIAEFHGRNIDNNFLLSVLLKIVGDPDEAYKKDEEGNVVKTVGQAFDEEMNDRFSGSKNGGSVMVLWSKLKEQFPEIQAFPTNTNHDLFIALQQLTVDNISIATKVPPILANIQVSGKLGNSQELINSIRLMQQRVNKRQRKLERAYNELLSGFVGAPSVKALIKNLNPITEIPDVIFNSLSMEEKREYIKSNYDVQLIENVTNGV